MEQDFGFEKCRDLGKLIESYILVLWEHTPSGTEGKSNSLVESMKAYIDANLDCEINLPDMAALFHYHPQYLGRVFMQATGLRFSAYLNRERVKRAAIYLSGGSSVINVAYQVGFHNVTYFNRVFRQHFGCSPSKYREQLSGKNG